MSFFGCYIGQELISRTYYSGIVRRRLMPFKWLFNDSLEINMPEDLTLKDEKGQRQGKVFLEFFFINFLIIF